MKVQGEVVVVKKYSNRRLYDTGDSRYITLDELAQKIRGGSDVRVVDAKSHDDLTQQTLTQIILENRRASRLLPVPLLMQLIRMQDDDLAEFFGKYMSWAMDLYNQAKRGAQAMAPFNPFANLPFSAANTFARMFSQAGNMTEGFSAPPPNGAGMNGAEPPPPVSSEPPAPPPPSPAPSSEQQQISDLRKELELIKEALLKKN